MLILRGPGGVDIRGGSVNFTSNGPLQLNAQVSKFNKFAVDTRLKYVATPPRLNCKSAQTEAS